MVVEAIEQSMHVTPDRIGGIYWKDASKFEPDLAALQNFSLAPVSLPGGCRTVMSR
jgi:hypothetical protein